MSKLTNSKKSKKLNSLETLLAKHKDQFQTLQNGKIKCLITGHQFLPSQQNVLDHLKSKSYKKASESKFDISFYQDALQTHKDNQHFLFCRLTGAKVPKRKSAIQKHVNGRRFKTRLQEYRKKQQNQQVLDQQGAQDEQQVDNQEQLEEQQIVEQQEQLKQQKAKNKNKKNKNVSNKKSIPNKGQKHQSNQNGKKFKQDSSSKDNKKNNVNKSKPINKKPYKKNKKQHHNKMKKD